MPSFIFKQLMSGDTKRQVERQGGEYTGHGFFVPASYVHQQAWRRAQARGLETTTVEGVGYRRVDDTVKTKVAVMPRDERDAKYGKPLVYADMTPGRQPILYAGGGTKHVEEMEEKVAEMRHYGVDQEEQPDRPDMQAVWSNMVEYLHGKQKDLAKGRKYYT